MDGLLPKIFSSFFPTLKCIKYLFSFLLGFKCKCIDWYLTYSLLFQMCQIYTGDWSSEQKGNSAKSSQKFCFPIKIFPFITSLKHQYLDYTSGLIDWVLVAIHGKSQNQVSKIIFHLSFFSYWKNFNIFVIVAWGSAKIF